MNRDGHEDVTYFIGPEVEKTPAADKRTLFVVGKQDVVQIERMAREYKTPHIFLGANHSFNGISDAYWDMTITALLDKGFWVTLDYQAHLHDAVLKMLNPGIWQSRLFIPMLSVRIPNLQTSSPNLTIKFDDIDFKATNEGVWCLNHHEVTDSNRFTPWQDYTTDEVVAPLSGPVPNPVLKISIPDDVVTKLRVPEPVYADINKPALNMEAVKNIVEAGLDPDAPSKLKPEDKEEKIPAILSITSPADAAEAYAEGTTTDPLAAKEPEKKTKVKK